MAASPRISTDQDSPWKEALEHFLEWFLALLFPDVHNSIDWSRGYESLDKELQQIIRGSRVGRRLADKLFRVWRKDGREAWLLVHVEVQGKRERAFTERMFVYNYRIFDRYHRPAVSLAVLCDADKKWRPTQFRYNVCGCTLDFRFPMVKLLDFQSQIEALEANGNPFAAVVLAHLMTAATRETATERLRWKLSLIKGLYDRGLDAEKVRQLFRVLDWMMALPAELDKAFLDEIQRFEEERRMPYVTSVERLALQQGREEGLEEGVAKGWQDAICANLVAQFGAVDTKVVAKLRKIQDVAQLHRLVVALKSAKTIGEVKRLLQDE